MSYQLEESAGNVNSPIPSPIIIPHKTNEEIKKEAESSDYVGMPSFKLDNPVFNEDDPRIQNDIVLMMQQYLDSHGYHMTASTLIDEAEMKHKDILTTDQINTMKTAIQEGNWDLVKQNIKYIPKHNQKSFLYEITRQQYLELIDKHEYQLAFTILTKNLKPLEPISRQYSNAEFSDLCYILTCKSVRGVASFKPWWNGVNSYRDVLIDELETMNRNDIENNTEFVTNNRLVNLLQQAYKYQIQNSVYHPRLNVTIPSLLCDYKPFIIPNYIFNSYEQHTNNCVAFIGDKGNKIASGSCDKTINIYDLETNEIQTLLGHNSRIWSLDSTRNGELLVSSSGSGDLKLWNLKSPIINCINTYHTSSLEHNSCNNDIYCVRLNPNSAVFACGGYQKVCHVYDIETGKIIKSFSANPSGTSTTTATTTTTTNYNYNTPTTSSSSSSITHLSFNPYGNILVVSSKDCKIRFYDLLSGVCIMSLPGQLSEVTSIEYNMNGNLLLSATKDSSNRIWDIRNKSVIQKFKGHQNFVSNFVKASFGMNDKIVISGSEDGIIYMWSIESGELIERLEGHKSVVYEAKWNNNKCLLASCSNDGTVKTWNYNSKKDKMKN